MGRIRPGFPVSGGWFFYGVGHRVGKMVFRRNLFLVSSIFFIGCGNFLEKISFSFPVAESRYSLKMPLKVGHRVGYRKTGQ